MKHLSFIVLVLLVLAGCQDLPPTAEGPRAAFMSALEVEFAVGDEVVTTQAAPTYDCPKSSCATGNTLAAGTQGTVTNVRPKNDRVYIKISVNGAAGVFVDQDHLDLAGAGVNIPPVASFSWSADGLDVDFTDQSTDESALVDWMWDFGDGASSSAVNPSHTYASFGSYDVTLTVTDDSSATGEDTQLVVLSEDPPPPSGDVTGIHGAGVSNFGEKNEGLNRRAQVTGNTYYVDQFSMPDTKNWMGKCSLGMFGSGTGWQFDRCWADWQVDIQAHPDRNRALWEIGIGRKFGQGNSPTANSTQKGWGDYTINRMRDEMVDAGVPEGDIIFYVLGLNTYPPGIVCSQTDSNGPAQASDVAAYLANKYSWVRKIPGEGIDHPFHVEDVAWLENDRCHFAPDGRSWPDLSPIAVGSGTWEIGKLEAVIDYILADS